MLDKGRMVVPTQWLATQGCLLPGELQTDGEALCPDFAPDDTLLILDASWHCTRDLIPFYTKAREAGCRIIVVIYDLIALQLPDTVPVASTKLFPEYYSNIVKYIDGTVAISKTVADSFKEWVKMNTPERYQQLKFDFWHLGCHKSKMLRGSSTHFSRDAHLEKVPFFLMVGSIEPRKNHALAIAAIHRLRLKHPDIELCIVGAHTWMCDALMERLKSDQEDGVRFIYNADDQELAWLYTNAKALLFVSRGEGFGLPIIEAAQFGTPILCSDIPVFHELCGKFATYVHIGTAENLVADIEEWLERDRKGLTPDSSKIPWLTWEESANQLLDVVFAGRSTKPLWQ
jgi:glycosyltransferase involved in cell wall biosynthesis